MLLFFVACAVEPLAPELTDTVPYMDGELLLRVRGDDVDEMHLDDENNLEEAERIDGIRVRRVFIPDGKTVRSVIEKLSEDHRVEFAEPNLLVRANAADPYVGYQWNLADIGVSNAWTYGTGAGVKVAVLDTGVKAGGPDGIANLLGGYDFYNGDSSPADGNGHGTFVAGTIGQKTNNGIGVAGVAPGVSILPVKVMGDDGTGDIAAIANGMVYATDEGASVINMSLGSAYPSRTLEQACAYAHSNGVTVVAASGNEYASNVGYPAAYGTVIAVGATGYDGVRAGYSNTGAGLDLVAPGGDMGADVNGDGYGDGILQETTENGSWTYTFWEGTSMAAPHVAAAAALVIAQGVTDPVKVAQILQSSARDGGFKGYDTSYGYGSLDVGAAVALARGGSSGSSGSSSGVSGGSSGSGSGSSAGDAGAADKTAPAISGVTGYTQSLKFTIQWVTNEPADSYLNFAEYGPRGDATLVTSHSLSFNGQKGLTYTFTIESRDASGNLAQTTEYYITL